MAAPGQAHQDGGDGGKATPLRALKAWAATPKRKLLLIGAAVGAVALTTAAVVFISEGGHAAATPQAALRNLDRGEFGAARLIARRLEDATNPTPTEQAVASYVLGMVAARLSEQRSDQTQQNYRQLAVRYLAEAQQRGFPRNCEAQGLYTLGSLRFHLRRYPGCVEALELALRRRVPATSEPIGRLTFTGC